MIPVTADMKKLFDKVDIYMNKATLDVEKTVMTEKGGDNTSMDFFNTKRNTAVNETLFKVK